MITVARFVLTATLWLLLLPFYVLWVGFSELVEWTERRGQRRYRRIEEAKPQLPRCTACSTKRKDMFNATS